MKSPRLVLATCLLSAVVPVLGATGQLASFTATALTGETVTEQKLIGQPTVLIVTPSRAAAEDTRKWAQALRTTIDQNKVMIRDILAIDLPFFMSERDALERARDKIPSQYHDQTLLLAESALEKSLQIPTSSEDAFVLVLNARGRVIARVQGAPTPQRLGEIDKAVSRIAG